MGALTERWHSHVAIGGVPRMHFVLDNTPESILHVRSAADQLGFRLFQVDCGHVTDSQSLMAKLDKGIGFPSYFGWNWDALNEVLCDLVGHSASGYVICLQNSDGWLSLRNHDAKIFVGILESAVAHWRDVRHLESEGGEDTPLHIVHFGGGDVVSFLEESMVEPLCRHTPLDHDVLWLPGGLGSVTIHRRAEAMASAGDSISAVAQFLRNHNLQRNQVPYIVSRAFGISIASAQSAIDTLMPVNADW